MATYLRFDVELLGMGPRIWRSFLLRDTSTFLDLHRASLAAGGWSEDWSGGYCLQVDGAPFAEHEEEGRERDEPFVDSSTVPIASVLGMARRRTCFHRIGPAGRGEDYAWERVDLVAAIDKIGDHARLLLGGANAYPKDPSWTRFDYEWALAGVYGRHTDVGVLGVDWREEILDELGGWHPEQFDIDTLRTAFDK